MPGFGPVLGFVVTLWTLVAGVMAIQQPIRVSGGRALLISTIGGFAVLSIGMLVVLVWTVAIRPMAGN